MGNSFLFFLTASSNYVSNRVGRTEREKETKAPETSTSSSILAGWLLSLEGVEAFSASAQS